MPDTKLSRTVGGAWRQAKTAVPQQIHQQTQKSSPGDGTASIEKSLSRESSHPPGSIQ